MPSSRPAARLADILENIDRIEAYTAGLDLGGFERDLLRRDAVERCLLRISEAARKLGAPAESIVPGQPWAAIRSLGNVLRHDYDDVAPAIIWRIVESELAPLKRAVRDVLERLGGPA